MKRKEFRHINVALVDFTKAASDPEFAGFKHKQNAPAETRHDRPFIDRAPASCRSACGVE